MEIIINAYKTALNVLGRAKITEGGYRLIKYCVVLKVEEGVLLFHTLTRELLLLTPEEYENHLESSYLRERWFVVPEDTKEKEYADLVRWVCKNAKKKPQHITKYTILTTTDCNARCFYCYEKGYKKYPMSEETADKTAAFIKENCGGEKVHISWFGGEPLYNSKVIDRICRQMHNAGVKYQSSMVSNGYLFDDEMIEKALNIWNLKSVQITLDGTEEIYNRSKAFIYRDGSAYKKVLSNIERLLDAKISVVIRMNMDLKNAEDLLKLTEELAKRFQENRKPIVYAHLIFDDEKSWTEIYSKEELTKLYRVLTRLEEKFETYGFSKESKKGLRRYLKLNHCMADSGGAVVITPDGHLGLCEHFAESELIGHINFPERDQGMIENWKQWRDEQAECAACFYYPECVRLKKCTGYGDCTDLEREKIRKRTQRSMKNELYYWKIRQSRSE